MKKVLLLLLASSLTWMSVGVVEARDPNAPDGDDREGYHRKRAYFEPGELKGMSPQERRVALRRYRDSIRESKRGIKVTSDRQFIRLDPPRRYGRRGERIPGSNIAYDSGAVVGMAGADGNMLGNRFNSALNPAGTMCCFPVEASGSITMITFDMVNTFSNLAIWSLFTDIMGTTAMNAGTATVPVNTGLNTVNTTRAYANGSFVAGIWQSTLTDTALGVDTMSTGGQGFHAVSISTDSSGSLTDVTTGMGGGLNAVFRVSGNVATPVELMSFSIED